jgi:hypothetical protein
MNTEIQRVIETRFELKKSAPIQTSSLRQLVGFCALTTYAKDLHQGELAIPTDIDEATTELILEMQQLWTRPRPIHGHTKNHIGSLQVLLGESKQEHLIGSFQDSLRALEGLAAVTGVDKAGLLSAKSHCLHWGPTLTLGEWPPSATREGPGSTLVDKLQTILLMDGVFNFINKRLFGHVAVSKLFNLGYIPEDQYSKKSIITEDSKLNNHLTMDLLH